MKLIIGNKNYSSWSLRAWLFLSWHELPFEEVNVPLFEEGYKDTLLSYSSAGQVPVLLDGDLCVWDSLAICEYVSERYLEGRGWPKDSRARAVARSASTEMHAGFSAIRSQMPMNTRATGRQVGLNPGLETELARVEQLWNELLSASQQGGPWLFGEFCIADCMYAPIAFRFNTYGVQLTGAAAAYQSQLLEQPVMQQWLAAGCQEPQTIAVAEVGLS